MGINNFNLIFDRTQADVNYALSLEREGVYTDENLRGAYNFSDRNRVASALNFLMDTLHYNGYQHMGCVNDGWQEGDIIYAGDNHAIIKYFREAERVLPRISLEIPDNLDYLSYQKANAAENILFDMFENYDFLADTWLYCGEGYMGDVFEEHKFDDYWT